jgi:dienelactone hydrolase
MKNYLIILLLIFSSIDNYIIAQTLDYQTKGVENNLPVFYKKLAERQTYPLSWTNSKQGDFKSWQRKAKAQVMSALLSPPPAVSFEPKIISEIDRRTYVARKVVFNVTGDSRVLAYMLVPKSKGKHPAVLLLHDHGGFFEIGKEKLIEPWDVSISKIDTAKNWTKQYYGGKFIGDELAKRGYVCLAVDMLNWGDRGGAGADGQQALNSNLTHLGSSFAGLIAHEDLRAAEFLSQQPEIDSKRIAAMGLSVGGFRTWQIAALSEHIAAGISVCWMTTFKGVMVPNNNQTRGSSAYTMTHSGISQYLDYPDVASIACPKPMMFLNGNRDKLFPVESIKEGFAKMRTVWQSQNVNNKLITNLYDAPHEFNLTMQSDAFNWLDTIFLTVKK